MPGRRLAPLGTRVTYMLRTHHIASPLARSAIPPLRVVGLLLLCDAQDGDEETISLLLLALSLCKPLSSQYGPRGTYHPGRSEDSFDLLLNSFQKEYSRHSADMFE